MGTWFSVVRYTLDSRPLSRDALFMRNDTRGVVSQSRIFTDSLRTLLHRTNRKVTFECLTFVVDPRVIESIFGMIRNIRDALDIRRYELIEY